MMRCFYHQEQTAKADNNALRHETAQPPPKRRLCSVFYWSGREDLNLRPPVPHTGALPSCATPRYRE